ncbi:hypothetical protein TruAng_001808 [Truncatella angustata]|nr:hypothetical protein TruAng_001808 [Truncatella angustata]
MTTYELNYIQPASVMATTRATRWALAPAVAAAPGPGPGAAPAGHRRQAPGQAQKATGSQGQAVQAGQRHSTRNYSAAAATAKHAHIAETATEYTTRSGRRHSARMKRPLDVINPNPDPTKVKRSRIAVEIKALPQFEPPSPPRSIVVRAPPPPATAADVTTQRQTQRQQKTQQNKPPPSPSPPPATAAEVATQSKTAHKSPTSHQKKVQNGIRHELDRLQPTAADAGLAKEQGRKLRSQEATRFKSELSAYFPDYDEVIGNDAKEHHTLNVDTPILIADSAASPHRASHPRQAAAAASQHKNRTKNTAGHRRWSNTWISNTESHTVKPYGDQLYTSLCDAQRIDLPLLAGRHDEGEDPLPDSLYGTAHRRAERLEKTIRNTEKGRAQHEKDQIIRILGELQGPDWLRTMGVNGVTESKKKSFEPARNHFIKGCQAILDKFRWWTREEKRRKLERDRALAEEVASSDSEEAEEEEEEEEDGDHVEEDEIPDSEEDEEMFDVEKGKHNPADDSDGDPPDSSDVDVSIAKQLQEEALARVKRAPSVSNKRPRREPSPSPMLQPPRVFKSFFEKRHERDAALSRPRRSRRAVMAWGHNIPDALDENFELSEEYRDDETMQARERKKRRERRGSRR